MKPAQSKNPLVRFQAWFEHGFESIRNAYRGLLETLIRHRRIFVGGFLAGLSPLVRSGPMAGTRLLPSRSIAVNSRCTCAPRPERGLKKRAALCDRVEDEIRKQIPPQESERHHR